MSKANIANVAILTDIHFGAKGNSEQHNQDCLDYIDWFCSEVKANDSIDTIAFLGDWYENRNAINVSTINYSYIGAKKINELGFPVYFITGNHDLYHRHTREIHSVVHFNEFDHFILIEEPTVIENKDGDILFCPYMFHNEYGDLKKYLDLPVWMGHFEFKGFVVTGSDIKMHHGPEPSDFAGPKVILSGHFHKRQLRQNSNIVYVGNTFPTTFGDANDYDRGMCTYDVPNNKIVFKNWKDCPKYIKTKLSDVLDKKVDLLPNSYVKCLADEEITFEESGILKRSLIKKHNLRDFVLEESLELTEALTETEVEADFEVDEMMSIDEIIPKMLDQIESDKIDNNKLIRIYNKLCQSSSRK